MIRTETLLKIKELEEKHFRIGFYPTFEKKIHQWTVCVRVGDDQRLTFIKGDPGLYNSSFKDLNEGLEAIIKFCEEYVPKRTKEFTTKTTKNVRKNK